MSNINNANNSNKTTIDWTRKLTSRKLWLSIASFVSLLIIALGGSENEATQVTALIMAGASVISYTLAEGWADSVNAGVIDIELEEDEEG